VVATATEVASFPSLEEEGASIDNPRDQEVSSNIEVEVHRAFHDEEAFRPFLGEDPSFSEEAVHLKVRLEASLPWEVAASAYAEEAYHLEEASLAEA
jgi:hypothetical protein